MTLAASVRVPFSRAIANLRDDWEIAGVEAAMVELSQRIADPGECLALMLAWSRRGDARTPAGVLQAGWRSEPERVAPVASTPTPASLTVWCDDHGANARIRTDGQLSCCWQAARDSDSEPYRRVVTPPPAGLREQVAAALHREAIDG